MKKFIQSLCTSLLLIGFLSFATPKTANAQPCEGLIYVIIELSCATFYVGFSCNMTLWEVQEIANHMDFTFCLDTGDRPDDDINGE